MLKKIALGTLMAVTVAQPTFASDKVTLILDWFLNPDHAPIAVAEQIGAFKKHDLDVEIVPPADPSLPPRLVAAKQADLAITYQPQLYMFTERGLPVVRVGTLVSSPLNTVLALKASGIKTIGDFKGKTIGYSVSGVENATLGTMLKAGGLSMSDVTMVNVNFALVSALMSGRVDGVIGGYRNFEANELRERGVDPTVFKVEDYGVPTYDELVIIANKDEVGDPKIKRFLIALQEGTAYLQAHPDETWSTFAKDHPDLDNELNKTAWKETVPLFAKDPAALDTQKYANYGKFLFDNKLIKAEPPVSDYAIEIK